jgi:hypothetical protein
MATVRVSFLLGGERFHGRLNRSAVLSDVPAKATRVNRAGPGYKVIRLRGLSHTDNMTRTRQYFHVATDEGRSFPLRLQPELDQAAALAQSVAHREPTAALSQDPDSLLQSHFFVFNPSSTRRRMASERDGSSACLAAQASTAPEIWGGSRTAETGCTPPFFLGRPRDFLFTGIDFFIFSVY